MSSRAATPQRQGRIRLDNNEGGRLSEARARSLSSCPPAVLREYPSATDLERRLAERFGVEPERVIVTAGADDAIDRCFRVLLTTGRSLILTAPTFQQFHRFAASTPATVREVVWRDRFPVEEVLHTIDAATAVVAFATPNNPTGRVAQRSDLERISRALQHGHVLLDHAYVEYAEEDFTAYAATLPNVIIVRTFSKAWGMAGCRVGYAIAPTATALELRNVGNPYPVSGPSITAVTRRLEEGTHEVERHVMRVGGERRALTDLLAELGGPCTPSSANFVFADFGDPERVMFVKRSLEACDIGVRAFPDRPELANGLRISLPDDTPSFAHLEVSLRTVLDPEVLLFDMDGVIADVSGSYDRCIRETAAHFGITVSNEEVDEVALAGDASNDWVVVQRLLAARGKTVALEDIRTHFQSLYEGPNGNDGYAKSERPTIPSSDLRELSGGRRVGIVTGRPRAEAMGFLQRFGLDVTVDALVCMEDGPGKPDPAPVLRALQQLGASSAWMLGDSPDDIVAARAAGVLPIGVAPSNAKTRNDALARAGAAVTVPDIETLRSYLR